jgi:hypothetical protein
MLPVTGYRAPIFTGSAAYPLKGIALKPEAKNALPVALIIFLLF